MDAKNGAIVSDENGKNVKYTTAKRQRQEYTEAILKSPSKKKIVVAGPGTGKTHLFERILEGKTNKLTLSFVNALVEDLSLKFCGLSEVRTLHSFALEIMKEETGEDINIHPRITEVISNDAKILLNEEIDFEHLFHNKTAKKKHIAFYKSRKKYYGGRYGFSDIMFAAVWFLEKNKDKIREYDQVLVDEFQDFNESEVALIDLLAKRSPILLVGDDDQALYAFKSAGPGRIRQRYSESALGYDPFPLPYCSRSTRVIVEATNDIIKAATKNGYLRGRIDKPFWYFDDEDKKDKVSDENPHIIYRPLHAGQIPFHIQRGIEKIAKQRRKEFTVLIICPYNKFCNTVVEALKKKGFVNISYKEKEERNEPALLDGLKLLLKDRYCNLGWRIVAKKLLTDSEFETLLKKTNGDGSKRIFELIGKRPKKKANKMLQTLRAVRDGNDIEDEELAHLLKKVNIDAYERARESLKDDIKSFLPPSRREKENLAKPEVRKIPITITTIQGSKGLDADYVFITYFDDEFFVEDKEDKTKISDQDICKFIVALTRAKRKVFLFSSNTNKKPIFLKWIDKSRIFGPQQ